MIPKPVQRANWALAFLLELVALGALLWWGFHTGSGLALHLLLGLGTPVLTAVLWGTFLAPRATRPLPVPLAITAKLAVFLVAAVAAYAVGAHAFAVGFAVVAVLNTALLVVDREAMEIQAGGTRG
ncbi:YrdB family protein [Streptacidiphilus fuscans]|uniref:YrdB family protein n=1 Tax=Streptacidiphilus fuscans TaxID=2789292 RepID=A0A931B7B0_9ACTN|nr:YrdB family protein [Streptacidiphilus fuscans]MBF9071548.1 YrdB family protein [Streptacidiphilus fuscans]